MFGYVRLSKENLSCEDYEIYKSYYCGLCYALRKFSSVRSCITLSYEAVFIFMLLSAVYDEEFENFTGRCIFHPAAGVNMAFNHTICAYCAHMNVIFAYLKIRDNISDDKNLKAYAAEVLFRRSYKKSRAVYPEYTDKICLLLGKLNEFEQKRCGDIDVCADCFAEIFALVLCPDFIKNINDRRILYSVGYNLGRWIYIIDAIDDTADDYKSGRYNPFFYKYPPEKCGDINTYRQFVFSKEENMLIYTLYKLSAAFELLDIKRNRGILENIIYSGLKETLDKLKMISG